MATGSILTGTQIRTKQTPLYDSFGIATTTPMPALTKMFGNTVGLAGIGPEITNMDKSFELPGGNEFLVRSLRMVVYAAAADIVSFAQKYVVRLYAAGIKLLDAPPDFWPGGTGVSTSASNGLNDPRAITGFDLDPIRLTDGINFRVEVLGTTFTTTAAFFARVYLDGRWTEPV